MSTNPIATGFWIDWPQGMVIGSSITLHTRVSNALLVFAGLWLGSLTAGWVWEIIASMAYRRGTQTTNRDGIHMQHQLVWRNIGDPLGAMMANLNIYLERSDWRRRSKNFLYRVIPSTTAIFFRRSTPARPTSTNSRGNLAPRHNFNRLLRRTIGAVTLPFVVWAGFVVAGVFVSYIATTNHDVLIEADLDACGIWVFPEMEEVLSLKDQLFNAYASKVLNDTLYARNYAKSCYANQGAGVNPVSCSYFTKQTLRYSALRDEAVCPFVEYPGQRFEGGACDVPHSTGSYWMSTSMLDTNVDLGINTHKDHGLGFKKTVNCSVLSLENRTGSSFGYGTQAGADYTTYQFGPISAFEFLGDNVTEFINPTASRSSNVAYQVQVVYASPGGPYRFWTPSPPFNLTDGDVSLFFLVSNSVLYETPVYDPYFLATDPWSGALGLPGASQLYQSINPMAVMGCVDQYTICTSSKPTAQCTPPSGIFALSSNLQQLPLSQTQVVTGLRLLSILQNSATFSSVYGTGSQALLASNKVLGTRSAGLPPNQWEIEAEGWFQTSLAKMQAYAVEFANNRGHVAAFANLTFPGSNSSTLPIWHHQCRSQRVANPGQYQVFSFLGLMILLFAGGLLYAAKRAVVWLESKHPSPDHDADDMFQLQNTVMGAPKVDGPEGGLPIQHPGYTAPVPQMKMGYIRYNALPSQPSSSSAPTVPSATTPAQPVPSTATLPAQSTQSASVLGQSSQTPTTLNTWAPLAASAPPVGTGSGVAAPSAQGAQNAPPSVQSGAPPVSNTPATATSNAPAVSQNTLQSSQAATLPNAASTSTRS